MDKNKPERRLIGVLLHIFVLGLTIHGRCAKFPDDWSIDESLYPQAYGILADEHLMHPVDLADWPVQIDASRQLFVDDYLIASKKNVTREIHRAKKYAKNPVLTGDKPWEGDQVVFQIVRRDEKTGRFRMWYTGWAWHDLPQGAKAGVPLLHQNEAREGIPLCYAESKDGIHWKKPVLNICQFDGSKANNILMMEAVLYGLIEEPNDPDPNRRYKGIVWRVPRNVPREGYFLYTSPDGIHWKQEREEPLALNSRGYFMPLDGIGDTTIFRWDRRLGKYIADVKFVLPRPVKDKRILRCRGMMESDDLLHWTRPRMTIYPDGLDDPDSEIYGHLSFCYESLWLGFMRMYHDKRTGWKQTTVELTASRDGRHWTRVGKREEVLPLGGPDEWDPDYHDPSGDPIRVGDELWIYYRGSRYRDRPKLPGRPDVPNLYHYSIGLATLRRDGFVSLNAGEQPGTIITRPLTFNGKSLFINAEVGKDGYIKVELQDTARKPIEPYRLTTCKPITGNGMEDRVIWDNQNRINHPTNKSVRLIFELKNAKLYSFWIK